MFDIQRFAEEVQEVEAEPVDEIQAKIEAAVTEQLTKAQMKWEEDFRKREEVAKKEAERLSKLSEDERAKAELENTRTELEKQKADFEREKLKYEAAKVLSQRSLPVEFVDYLIGADNESTLENIKVFEKRYNSAVEAAVTAKLKGTVPQSGGRQVENTSGKSAFMKAIKDAQVKYR